MIRLTDKEILKVYKDKNWIILEPDLTRSQIIAKAQLKKVVDWMDAFEKNKYYIFVERESLEALLKEVE